MKKILIVLVFLISLFVIVACNTETATTSGLVGTWEAISVSEYGTETTVFTFNKNGSGSVTMTWAPISGDPAIDTASFTWSATSNTLTLKNTMGEESHVYSLNDDNSELTFPGDSYFYDVVFYKQ